jgi:hypothetical protein
MLTRASLLSLLVVLAPMGLFVVQPCLAVTIDFNSVTPPQDFTTYAEDGFNITSTHAPRLVNVGVSRTASPAVSPYGAFGSGARLLLRASDGSLFDVHSVDLIQMDAIPDQFGLTFTGYSSFGGTVLKTFNMDGRSVVQPFTFDNFQDLDSLAITENVSNSFTTDPLQVDNILVSIRSPTTASIVTTESRKYSGVAFPLLRHDPSISAVLIPQLGSPSESIWKLGLWRSSDSTYLSAGADFTSLQRGAGYWLVTKDPKSITLTGIPPSDPWYVAYLQDPDRWYLLGNPYDQDLELNSIVVEDVFSPVTALVSTQNHLTERNAWAWNSLSGAYEVLSSGSIVRRYTSFWVKTLPGASEVHCVIFNPVSSGPAPAILVSSEPDLWSVKITARQGNEMPLPVTVGAGKYEVGSGTYSLSLPPNPPGRHLRLGILRHPSGNRSEEYGSAYKPQAPQMTWDLLISGAEAPGEVTLETRGEVPDGVRLFLHDEKQGSKWEVMPGQSLYLAATESPRKVSLEVETSGAGSLGDGNGHFHAYPNPARGSIGFVSRLEQVVGLQVDVFDVTGRRVRHLARPEAFHGENVIVWDGLDDRGRRVGGGVYFAHCRAGKETEVLRVVRLR